MENHEKTHRDFSKFVKAYCILRENAETSETEIKELIEYFVDREEYEIANKLKNLLS